MKLKHDNLILTAGRLGTIQLPMGKPIVVASFINGQQAAGQFEVSDKVAERLYSLRGQDLLLVVSQQPRAAGQPQAALVAAVPLTEALGALQRTFGDLCDLVEDEPAPAPVTAQAKEPAALAATIENPGKAVASDIKGKGKG